MSGEFVFWISLVTQSAAECTAVAVEPKLPEARAVRLHFPILELQFTAAGGRNRRYGYRFVRYLKVALRTALMSYRWYVIFIINLLVDFGCLFSHICDEVSIEAFAT